ncbi:hypothetical protein [Holdemania massiliensis]|uniref:ImmA/IrrE family metallo-endopeptidase n=1 Tax=Holdemania massiliensis TaxID=1468449 RepID=A0A6N7SD99_9FIRM|nr:hypothetical protein [Holdemania massiliensis]MSA73273.1 hypothetical protein [Holdemania massiliensis]MSA91485.1 hypothetical protein [Holdemania massiliensis]MSB80361.1 hypothetical protein [Holdemania massiliensis]MSC35301.1 hypothetical protein [Holdemania massiliensis]MSC41675.1 hypothetical protein [Holdemania massiliensis]
MMPLEWMEQQIYDNGIEIIPYDFGSQRIRAVYCDDVIGLSPLVDTDREKKCLLAEEFAHHQLNHGNILKDPHQETIARRSAHDRLIGLDGLIRACEAGCNSFNEVADYLDVTEEFLNEAIKEYASRYGTHAIKENYIIAFIPNLQIYKAERGGN